MRAGPTPRAVCSVSMVGRSSGWLSDAAVLAQRRKRRVEIADELGIPACEIARRVAFPQTGEVLEKGGISIRERFDQLARLRSCCRRPLACRGFACVHACAQPVGKRSPSRLDILALAARAARVCMSLDA